MNNLKLEDSEDNQLIKEEQFNDDIYTSTDDQFNHSGLVSQSYCDADNDLMENMTDYSDNMFISSSSKMILKYKRKIPSAHKVDVNIKFVRKQNARKCRARKKLRYKYLEELVLKRENANLVLMKKIEQFKQVATGHHVLLWL